MYKTDHSKLFTLCSRNAVATFQEAPVENIKHIGLAALGLSTTFLGFYQLYNGISGFAYPSFNSQAPVSLDKESVQTKCLHKENIPANICTQELQKAKKTFLSCPEAKKLWNEVEQQGTFTLQCDSKLMSQGAVYPETRDIVISNNVLPGTRPMPLNDVLAFELINLKNSKTFVELSNNRCSMVKNEFAQQAEMYEMQTVKSFNSLIKNCREKGFWADSMPYNSDEKQVLLDQKNYGHTSTYHLSWMTKCDFKNLEKFMASLIEMREKGVNLPPNFKAVYEWLSKNPTDFFKKVLSKVKL